MESLHDFEEAYSAICDALEAQGFVLADPCVCGPDADGNVSGALFFNDTINKRTYAINFNRCDEYEGD